ncbi:MAG: substrate-binding domain-containing protein [Halobacteriales archaeon]
MDRRRFLHTVAAGSAIAVAGCIEGSAAASHPEASQLALGATTTIHDSGLLDALLPGFEDRFDTRVKPVIRGSGAVLRTAADGDVDVVFVHARPLEDERLREGAVVNRRAVMVNDFLVVGPAADPAEVADTAPLEAFRRIAAEEATFLSRGDRSGTHLRARQLWEAAGLDPAGTWYRETGQGMGNTLSTARKLGAYTLTDRGTFLATRTGALAPLVNYGLEDPPPALRNEYAALATNPARNDTAYSLAMAFIGYLTGPAQERIREFRIDGEPAFRPIGLSAGTRFSEYVPSDWSS